MGKRAPRSATGSPPPISVARTRTLDEAEAGARLWDLLKDAVRSHMVSDVPVGAFLSGGMDSSTVVALMAREVGVPVKTFSVGFGEARYNEAPLRAPGGRVVRDRAPRANRDAARPRAPGRGAHRLRRALRRRLCDPYLSRLPPGPAARQGGAIGRRRRRALRGLRSLRRRPASEAPRGSRGSGAGGTAQTHQRRSAGGNARQELPPPFLPAPDGALPRRDLSVPRSGPSRSAGARRGHPRARRSSRTRSATAGGSMRSPASRIWISAPICRGTS